MRVWPSHVDVGINLHVQGTEGMVEVEVDAGGHVGLGLVEVGRGPAQVDGLTGLHRGTIAHDGVAMLVDTGQARDARALHLS